MLTHSAASCHQALLQELVESKQITANSKWKDSFIIFGKDPRYLNLLGKPGSTPLDLWMDVVDDLEQELEQAALDVEKVLIASQVIITPNTSYEEVTAVIDANEDLASMEDSKLKLIFDYVCIPSYAARVNFV